MCLPRKLCTAGLDKSASSCCSFMYSSFTKFALQRIFIVKYRYVLIEQKIIKFLLVFTEKYFIRFNWKDMCKAEDEYSYVLVISLTCLKVVCKTKKQWIIGFCKRKASPCQETASVLPAWDMNNRCKRGGFSKERLLEAEQAVTDRGTSNAEMWATFKLSV